MEWSELREVCDEIGAEIRKKLIAGEDYAADSIIALSGGRAPDGRREYGHIMLAEGTEAELGHNAFHMGKLVADEGHRIAAIIFFTVHRYAPGRTKLYLHAGFPASLRFFQLDLLDDDLVEIKESEVPSNRDVCRQFFFGYMHKIGSIAHAPSTIHTNGYHN